MKVEIRIKYNWDLSDYLEENTTKKPLLEENAINHITEMIKQGYTSGELHYEDDEIEVSGWWEKTTIKL